MKKYIIDVTWEMAAKVEITADTKEEAIAIAYRDPLPKNGDYVDNSFEVILETIEDRLCLDTREYTAAMMKKGHAQDDINSFLNAVYEEFGDDVAFGEDWLVAPDKDLYSYNLQTKEFTMILS